MDQKDGEVDRISELGDDIIVMILSFLPLEEAVATSVLSTRWSDSWKHIPNLNFNARTGQRRRLREWDVKRCKNIPVVNSVLQSHKAPSLKELRISFYVNKSAQSTVAKWLEFAFSRQVESLELDFQCNETSNMLVLEELLKETSSSKCRLKSLCLKFLKVSGEAITLLLRNCPLLERLAIKSATLTSDVEFRGANLMLQLLEIHLCSGGKSIKVSAPNLTRIAFDDRSVETMSFENLPKLVWAHFKTATYQTGAASAVLGTISQLEILQLNVNHPEVFFANKFPKMPNLKALAIHFCAHSVMPVTALIWASPRLQKFKLMYWKSKKDPIACVVTNVKTCPHQHLKVFEFQGFCGNDVGDHIQLITYILDNCVALQKIIVRCIPIFPCARVKMGEIQACRDYVNQQLRGKLPHHIQLQIL